MRIVLDTNALISTLSRKLNFQVILNSLILQKYDLYITNEILLEYEEKLSKFFDTVHYQRLLELFDILPNVKKIKTYYNFALIIEDPSDNKFVNCAFCCNADYIVTNDKHFDVLKIKRTDNPEINVVSIERFSEILRKL